MQMRCSFQRLNVQHEFLNENVLRVKWSYFKSHDSQIVPNAIFEIGGITIQNGILHVLLNI